MGTAGEQVFTESLTAVYRLYAADDTLLYVGVTGHLGARMAEHAAGTPWWAEVARKTVAWHETREAALLAESDAVRDERPRYNVAGAPRAYVPGIGRDRHRETPTSFRLNRSLRQWVYDYAERHGLPVRRVIVDAVREKRDREEGADS